MATKTNNLGSSLKGISLSFFSLSELVMNDSRKGLRFVARKNGIDNLQYETKLVSQKLASKTHKLI
jgi:hypothetical protein